MMSDNLYLINSEREACLAAIVNYEDEISLIIDEYCYDRYHDYNGEFWVQRCYHNGSYWVPDEDSDVFLEWVYDGRHYYEGDLLPDGRIVQ